MCYHTTDRLIRAVLTHSGETQTNAHSPQAGHQWQIKQMLPFRSNLMGQWVQLELLTGFGLKGDLQKYTQLQGSKLWKKRLISQQLTACISSEWSSPQELHDKILMGSILCRLLWVISAAETSKKTQRRQWPSQAQRTAFHNNIQSSSLLRITEWPILPSTEVCGLH